MSPVFVLLAACLTAASGAQAPASPAPVKPPAAAKGALPSQEELRYNVNWPSGLSLGEAQMAASKKDNAWSLTFSIEASVPGFQVLDMFRSSAFSGLLCSQEFERDLTHGRRKSREKTTFDGQRGVAVRETIPNGGKSEIETGSCARDALAYLYYLRQELGQGRIPSPQTVYFGSAYRVRLEYSGTQQVRVGESRVEADRVLASIKGPKSDFTVEVYFSRDGARTPVQVKVPLPLGTFSLDLAP